MSGPIQQVPKGLLSLLNMTTLGENPNELSDIVVPTINVADLYMQRETIYETNTVINEGPDTSETVPEGERWIVHNWTMVAPQVLPPDRLNFSCCTIIPKGGDELINLWGRGGATYTNHINTVWNLRPTAHAEGPLLFEAGTQFGVFVHDYLWAAGNPDLEMSMIFSRLRI